MSAVLVSEGDFPCPNCLSFMGTMPNLLQVAVIAVLCEETCFFDSKFLKSFLHSGKRKVEGSGRLSGSEQGWYCSWN